jgi:hypothetical protein
MSIDLKNQDQQNKPQDKPQDDTATLPEQTSTDQSNDDDNSAAIVKTVTIVSILWILYVIISFVTFIVWIVCGAKKNSAIQIIVGIFFSGLWPFLWLYVLVMKFADPTWKFCEIHS